MLPGMPLGAIGTGFISLGTDGTLDYVSTIFNAFLERFNAADIFSKAENFPTNLMLRRHIPSFRLPFLGIAVAGKTRVLSLQTVKDLQEVNDIAYWGHYPVADLEYDMDSPVSVGLRAWTPFLPGNAVESNTPGALFEVELRNITENPQQGTLVFNFYGAREVDVGVPAFGDSAVQYQRQPVKGKFRGVTVRTVRKEDYEYGYALGVVGRERIRLGGSLGGGNLEAEGNAWDSISTALPEPCPTHGGSSVAVDFSLRPGSRKKVRFILAWYAPFWKSEAGTRYVHMYHARFNSALEVAQLLAEEHASLLKRVLAWQQVVYAEKRIPGWLQDALINVLAIDTQNSFWEKSINPDHWWGDEGLFSTNESLTSCPVQSAIAGDWIGQWSVNLLFPGLSRNYLRPFKYHQRDSGEVPFAIGSQTHLESPGFAFQVPMNSQYYVHMIDRLWQCTGDDNVLREYYPSTKAAVNFIRMLDKDGDGLLETQGTFSQYYDNWEMAGVATHVAGFWLATQEIAERMAKKMGDEAFARDCRAWIERGKKTLEENLWNEEAGSYLQFRATKAERTSKAVISDQLIGEWFARVHGLLGIFSPERVRKVLATLERLNVAATPHGIQNSVPMNDAWDKSAIVPSYSTLVPAMLMIYSGDSHFRELGLEIVRRTWHNMVIEQQMTWDMPCMLHADGTRSYGLEYHHNTMLWTFPMAVLGQDIQSISSPDGFVHRIIQAAHGN